MSASDPAAAELVDPAASAAAARLHYVTDDLPGIRRRRAGKGWRYLASDGRPVHDPAAIDRIKALAIPPAWKDVWICRDPLGHLQATGRDTRGRKQYRYHPRWREVRDEVKYERMIPFAEALPRIRERVDHDLSLPGLPRERVLATVVRLLEDTLVRVGNEEYRHRNGSYGLTTLRRRHVDVRGSRIRFRFRGKHGKEHDVSVSDRRLARIVARCQDIPGQELFQYVDEAGERHSVGSADVNEYLREISGEEFTAKDFRTWAGTVLAVRYLRQTSPTTVAEARRAAAHATAQVAAHLGNTVAVCRACYVHPAVVDAYLAGSLATLGAGEEAGEEAGETLPGRSRPAGDPEAPAEVGAGDWHAPRRGLSAEERGVLDLLRRAPHPAAPAPVAGEPGR